MTNGWTDIGNASLVVAWGSNPSENHPACMAHINKARSKGAQLVVVDPRKTRTAVQADRYIRIRPGTDIALLNGVVRGIIAEMEGRDAADAQRVKFYQYLNRTDGVIGYTDGANVDGSGNSVSVTVPNQSLYTDARFIVNGAGTDYDRETVVAATGLPAVGGEPANTIISNFPKKAATVTASSDTVYNRLKAHVAPYTTAVVADICGCTEADIAFLVDAYINNSFCSTVGSFGAGAQNPTAVGYKATTMLYAMGLTQHTYGSQNVKGFAVLQTLMGNMGRAGGGINALRGIHNVQGSTDMGNLYHLIPGYSGNPATMTSADANAFGKYMNALWGTPVSGTGNKAKMDGSYDDAYNTAAMALQQRGFYNMTRTFFGDTSWATTTRALVDALYDLWPKTNGDDHITMFRKMGLGTIKAAVVWAQNPAVTEPNQSAIRDGLENLDTLVVVDMFETETAACSRKAGGVTYLIPAASHVEEAGSVTNSGRVLQWREECTKAKGNSKTDMELLLRFAFALDAANAFSHIEAVWTANSLPFTSAYATLYGRYGYTPGTNNFDDVSLTGVDIWHGDDAAPTGTFATNTVTGSEAVAELMYREMATGVASGGTLWIYTNGYVADYTSNKHAANPNWQVYNRAKSRDLSDPLGTLAFGSWGYSWLVNRRVLYNNSQVTGDVADFFMGPDSCARLFVSTNTAVLNYSRWYRTIHRLADKPDTCLVTVTAPHVLPGRFPAHTEPYETPRADLAATWGRNTKGTAQWDLVKSDTAVAGKTVSASGFPFVLTTIRCVEHFQGGPITRNNAWNVEAEPEPWIEINSLDAADLGIVSGDLVNVITARSDSTADQEGRTVGAAGFAQGFRARVGVGLQSNQRVAQGVVAIPWHWGDRGLSTGSRANDLCIDAGDANTVIPEYKACLCDIDLA